MATRYDIRWNDDGSATLVPVTDGSTGGSGGSTDLSNVQTDINLNGNDLTGAKIVRGTKVQVDMNPANETFGTGTLPIQPTAEMPSTNMQLAFPQSWAIYGNTGTDGSGAWDKAIDFSTDSLNIIAPNGGRLQLNGENVPSAEELTTALSTKANAASLKAVAYSGSYNDLTDKPASTGGGAAARLPLFERNLAHSSQEYAATASGAAVGRADGYTELATTAANGYAMLQSRWYEEPFGSTRLNSNDYDWYGTALITLANFANGAQYLANFGGYARGTSSGVLTQEGCNFVFTRGADGTYAHRVVTESNYGSVTETAFTITGNATHIILNVEKSSTQARYWVNGVLVATHTTNLPDTTATNNSAPFGFAHYTATNTNTRMVIQAAKTVYYARS